MTHDQVKQKLMNRLSVVPMGSIRIFKYLASILDSEDAAKEFMIKEGYEPWYVNDIIYQIKYQKKRYSLKLNTATITEKGF